MEKTNKNLKEALSGESQANRKYLAFAEKALKENMPGVAKLFRAAAESETIHAMNYLRMLGSVGSTKENLEDAKTGEMHEAENMYPQFVADAQEENKKQAETVFSWAAEVESLHAKAYGKALEKAAEGQDISEKKYFICQGCGYTAEDEAPETCPVCGAPKKNFKEIE